MIVVTGAYGSGKSTLALELAIDVARKGGAAIIAAMEQSAEECLYSMESLGISTHSDRFDTVREMREAFPLFGQPYSGKGVLAFLPIRRPDEVNPPDQLAAFIPLLEDRFEWMREYPLRLIVVDPMNSIVDAGHERPPENRRKVLQLFEKAKQRGINLCLTRERTGDLSKDPPFEENIADTVLHIVTTGRSHALRRSVEIRKSRLQREEPGRHALVMVHGKGLQIFPSSASVARVAAASAHSREPRREVSTGIDGIDRLLGRGGLRAGDLIALDGPPGSSRTLVGSHFLFVQDTPNGGKNGMPRSLFVSDSDESTIYAQLSLVDGQRRDRRPLYEKRSLQDIVICSMLADSVEPSQILHVIKEKFEQANKEKRPIDRVFLADVSRWDNRLDEGHNDDTFGHALMALLRRYGATCILLSDHVSGDRASVLRDVIVNGADCILKFEPMEFRGQVRHFVRATKTFDMIHRQDLYEMVVAKGAVDVRSTGVLLRKDMNGNVHPVKIRLFLHADSPRHNEFNARVKGAIVTSLADAIVEDQWSHYDPEMFRLSAFSGVDEVQVMQLDEYQLPSGADVDVAQRFFVFRPDKNDEPPHDFGQLVTRLGERIRTPDGGYIAVPFYQNISVLAIHDHRLQSAAERIGIDVKEIDGMNGSETWLCLRKIARAWESQGDEYLFFSCPFAQSQTVETYNCLYFEILLTFCQPQKNACGLMEWLGRPEAKIAAQIFRDLCYRSHRHERAYFENAGKPETGQRLRVFKADLDSNKCGAVLWRHWYNTLSEMMWDLPPSERSAISVIPLPGQKSSAGEWYLTVPAYSAAPELGWQIIQMITSPDRELQRIYHGVGLPTRESYYQHKAPSTPESLVSPFFHMPRDILRSLVDGAFQRSTFPCYQKMTDTISAHLQKILEMPASNSNEPGLPSAEVSSAVDHLLESMKYISDSIVCGRCGNRSVGAEVDSI